ncbi:TIM-barrel domain-containing protein [Nocardioides sambongensis]|uniref:TIM-barrel domain-containing protein n=1 Tax=Nocardioides sambongensis TaxID=2589074 RepID=UPI00112CA05C|nr:TIM-barrel domain-containing protein [Nocardioides sambongensis]
MATTGVSVWGPDIGGFMTLPGDPQRTTELLNRWIQYGAFTGVMRLQNGGIQIGVPTPPKVDDPAVASIWKRYARLRTMLYPYVAGSQDEYQGRGLPLMRHLSLVYPGDARAVRTDDSYLFGRALLVAPVTEDGDRTRKVYLPRGRWIELADAWRLKNDGSFRLTRTTATAGQRTVVAKAPLSTIPLFLRAGAVVPMLPRSVDTLSEYGEDVEGLVDLTDAERRVLLAAPRNGETRGTLGPDESYTSTVSRDGWTLGLAASQDRTYDFRATLAGVGRTWTPCRVEVGGKRVPFSYRPARRVLQFAATVPADGEVRVTTCD